MSAVAEVFDLGVLSNAGLGEASYMYTFRVFCVFRGSLLIFAIIRAIRGQQFPGPA